MAIRESDYERVTEMMAFDVLPAEIRKALSEDETGFSPLEAYHLWRLGASIEEIRTHIQEWGAEHRKGRLA